MKEHNNYISSKQTGRLIEEMSRIDVLESCNSYLERPYEKPSIEKEIVMRFPLDILESKGGVVCKQCSSCHSCR